MKYKIVKNEFGDIDGCDSCGCGVPIAPFDWMRIENRKMYGRKRMLCEICATTYVGSITESPAHPDFSVARMIAQVGNHMKSKLNVE